MMSLQEKDKDQSIGFLKKDVTPLLQIYNNYESNHHDEEHLDTILLKLRNYIDLLKIHPKGSLIQSKTCKDLYEYLQSGHVYEKLMKSETTNKLCLMFLTKVPYFTLELIEQLKKTIVPQLRIKYWKYIHILQSFLIFIQPFHPEIYQKIKK